MYENDIVVTKDREEDAIYWYTKSAKQGYAKAQFALGSLYYIRFEYKKSFYWTKKAVDQGCTPAELNLATYYYKGFGTEKNPKKAIYWYTKSAESGDQKAIYSLGDMYYYGDGMDKDYIKAYAWWSISLDFGSDYPVDNMKEIVKEMSPDDIKKAKALKKELFTHLKKVWFGVAG